MPFISFHSHIQQVLSMSRLGGAGAVAQLVTDIPLQSVEVTPEYENIYL